MFKYILIAKINGSRLKINGFKAYLKYYERIGYWMDGKNIFKV